MNENQTSISAWICHNWFKKIIVPIIILVVAMIIGSEILKIINPPILPNIVTRVSINAGELSTDLSDSFKIDYKSDKVPWIFINIDNEGKGKDNNLDIGFSLLKDNGITTIDAYYSPEGIESRVTKYKKLQKSFHSTFIIFPGKSNVSYKIHLLNFITSFKRGVEYNLSVVSDNMNWGKSISTRIQTASFFAFLSGNTLNSDKNPEKNETTVPKSNIFIGGYDPIAMANGVFSLLQLKKLIGKEDAIEIKETIKIYRGGVLIGGMNLLKFNELIINKLILKNEITQSQAKSIIEKSQKSGGILIGGYNVIVLQVELLNVLLKNRKIELSEGQSIIDKSKQPLKGN